MSGSEERAGETDPRRRGHRAPARPYHFGVRLEDERVAVLVLLGAAEPDIVHAFWSMRELGWGGDPAARLVRRACGGVHKAGQACCSYVTAGAVSHLEVRSRPVVVRDRITRVVMSGFAAWASAGCGGECDDVGASWCRGNILQECCLRGGGGHAAPRNQIKETHCGERGLVCSAETGKARCVFEAARCVDKAAGAAVCVGAVRAICEPGASQPEPYEDCSGDAVSRFCVESERAARCSPFPERCAEGDADRCEHELVASCVDEIWSLSTRPCFGECSVEGAMQCVESSDYLGRPAQGVARCIGQPGIWRGVGPLCETSCACDEEQMCRCQEWSEDFEAL